MMKRHANYLCLYHTYLLNHIGLWYLREFAMKSCPPYRTIHSTSGTGFNRVSGRAQHIHEFNGSTSHELLLSGSLRYHAHTYKYIQYTLAFLKPRKQCFYSSKRRGERRGYEWLTDVVTNVRRTSERTSARVSERVNGRVRTSGRTCARTCVRLHVHWPRARTYENKVDWSRPYFCKCKALQY